MPKYKKILFLEVSLNKQENTYAKKEYVKNSTIFNLSIYVIVYTKI